MHNKKRIDTGAEVMGPYSLGISVKDHIWLSGQIDNTATTGVGYTTTTSGTASTTSVNTTTSYPTSSSY